MNVESCFKHSQTRRVKVRMRKSLGIACGLSLAVAAAAAPNTPGVTQEIYGGWKDCLVMRGGDCKAIIVPAIGGRVLSYSINGENIIFDNPDSNGRTLLNSSNFWARADQIE